MHFLFDKDKTLQSWQLHPVNKNSSRSIALLHASTLCSSRFGSSWAVADKVCFFLLSSILDLRSSIPDPWSPILVFQTTYHLFMVIDYLPWCSNYFQHSWPVLLARIVGVKREEGGWKIEEREREVEPFKLPTLPLPSLRQLRAGWFFCKLSHLCFYFFVCAFCRQFTTTANKSLRHKFMRIY